MQTPNHIAIGVGGRFHSDRLAQALAKAGHRISLHTTLPRSRFQKLERSQVKTQLFSEIIYRMAAKMGAPNLGDSYKVVRFGREFASSVTNGPPLDAVVSWSSFGLEAFEQLSHQQPNTRRILIRDSSHIEYQFDLLREAYSECGKHLPPRELFVERELREYALADHIIVLSEFARQSFLQAGIDEKKLKLIRLGVDTSVFQPAPTPRKPGYPLRLFYFGSLSIQKGVQHLLEATKNLNPQYAKLYLAGPVFKDFRSILARYPHAHCFGPMTHASLSKLIQEMDLFVFPTLEDGFGQTLIQAMAGGLVPIVTDRCGAGEMIQDGQNGLIISANSKDAILSAIAYFLEAPQRIVPMRTSALATVRHHGWEHYDRSVVEWFEQILATPATTTHVNATHTNSPHVLS